MINIFSGRVNLSLSGLRESGRLLLKNGRDGSTSASRGDYNARGIKQYEIFMGGLYKHIELPARARVLCVCVCVYCERILFYYLVDVTHNVRDRGRPCEGGGYEGVDCYDPLLFYIIICHRCVRSTPPILQTGSAFCQI